MSNQTTFEDFFKTGDELKYTEESLKTKKGLEIIRERPSLFIDGLDENGLHRLVSEAIDNAADEHIAGFGDHITVTVHPGRVVEIKDNGRGIPFGEENGKSKLESVFTEIFSGGKFDPGAYSASGGLHGVGAKCFNALSKWLEVKTIRDGKKAFIRFENGVATSSPKIEDAKDSDAGTVIKFSPSSEYFPDNIVFNEKIIREKLQSLSYLNPNLTTEFAYLSVEPEVFSYENGVSDFISDILTERPTITESPVYLKGGDGGMFVELWFSATKDLSPLLLSFVNGIPTPEGGTHVRGIRDAVFRAVESASEILPKIGNVFEKLDAADVNENLVSVLHVKMESPQFSSQRKTKLTTVGASQQVGEIMENLLKEYFVSNPDVLSELISMSAKAATNREKIESQKIKLKKIAEASKKLGIPDYCAATKDGEDNDLFIFLTSSEYRQITSKRDSQAQACMRMNLVKSPDPDSTKVAIDKFLDHPEYQKLSNILGCGFGDGENGFKEDDLRFSNIIVCADSTPSKLLQASHLLLFLEKYCGGLCSTGKARIVFPSEKGATLKEGYSNTKDIFLNKSIRSEVDASRSMSSSLEENIDSDGDISE